MTREKSTQQSMQVKRGFGARHMPKCFSIRGFFTCSPHAEHEKKTILNSFSIFKVFPKFFSKKLNKKRFKTQIGRVFVREASHRRDVSSKTRPQSEIRECPTCTCGTTCQHPCDQCKPSRVRNVTPSAPTPPGPRHTAD